ncbi:MAG TPA: peptide-methionine (S)-S-oxide reductase [Nitrospiraceae bacterium]|nr:peptide-methionine (S)-S-oxide reductase [Nitrospiraceae bacterium]
MEQNKGTLSPGRETATLAGGCFWCLEAVFLELKGVEKVVSGYSGGAGATPSYREVSTGTTGHAEVVQIFFNAEEISYRDILEVFFTIHDPTTLNRQGADVGTQYRSAIFYHSDAQKNTAELVIRELERSDTWENPIVTEVAPFENFYPAENYHQEYYMHHGNEPYCRLVIAPKMAKLRKHFIDRLKK